MNADCLLQASQVSFSRGGRRILDRVDLQVRAREIVTLIGPNGAGKSSLISILLGLARADSGEVWRRPGLRIGYMPQRLHIDDNMPLTVQRFLRLANPAPAAIAAALAEVGCPALASTPLQAVSGGELQRVLLARALLREPQLLVLDEPVQGVDIGGQAALYQLIADLRERYRCGILMISHDLHLVMAQTDTVICLNQHVCCHGQPAQVSRDPAYLRLFGHRESTTLAVYQHHHDHQHSMDGAVKSPEQGGERG